MSRGTGLLREEPRFRRLLTAALASGIGTQLNRVGVLAIVYQTTGSSVIVSASIAVRMAAVVLTGPLNAYLADRLPRKRVLIGCDLACAAAAASLCLTTTRAALAGLFVLIAALEALSGLFSAARSATIPNIVAQTRLAGANGLDQSVVGLVTALGSLLGGVLVAAYGSRTVFVVNAASYLVSASLIAGITVPRIRRDTVTGAWLRPALRIIAHDRRLRFAVTLTAVWPLAGGVLSVLVTVYAYRTFHAAQLGVGALYGAIGFGYLAGGLAARTLLAAEARRTVAVSAGCYCIEGLCYAAASQAPSLTLACVLLALGTTSAAIGNTACASVVMTRTPDEFRGRVFAGSQTLASASQIVAMLTAGVVLDAAAPRAVGLTSGLLLTLLCGVMALRSRGRAPVASVGTPALGGGTLDPVQVRPSDAPVRPGVRP